MLAILSICRLLFIMYNKSYFPDQTLQIFLRNILTGLRFDLTTLIYFNLPFFLLLFYNHYFPQRYVIYIAKWLAGLANSLIIIANIIDIPYFPFSFQRISFQTLLMLQDSTPAFPSFFKKFWYFVAIAVILISLALYLNNINLNKLSFNNGTDNKRQKLEPLIALFTLLVLARGLNTFPITPSSSYLYVTSQFSNIVNNSAFNLAFSVKQHYQYKYPKISLSENKYDSSYFYHQPDTSGTFQKRNIIVFILESFSQSYLTPGHEYKANTPFLDSIMSKSKICENAFANGTMTINGLNSILGGVPPIAFQTIINSPFQDNVNVGIGQLLESSGYSTHFFFGSNDDHYGFKRLVRKFGISNYYGRGEFGNNAEYDGVWGIYDMPFMQYASAVLKKQKQPFFASILNISSHFPYKIPQPYAKELAAGPLNSSQSISYVDKSIQSFFNEIKTAEWFNETLFVFVADHWSHEDNSRSEVGINRYKIPLFFYCPDGSSIQPGHFNQATDQLSIIPTILDVINYPHPFISFGKSIINRNADSYTSYSMLDYPYIIQATNDSLTLQFNLQKMAGERLFLYKTDTALANNLLTSTDHLEELRMIEKDCKQFLNSYFSFISKNQTNFIRR
ncbi:MAG: LTA synthase family protein [Agriterribacter sp.]